MFNEIESYANWIRFTCKEVSLEEAACSCTFTAEQINTNFRPARWSLLFFTLIFSFPITCPLLVALASACIQPLNK